MSCNIWYALAGLDTGGGSLDAFARRLGFGAPLPFDLATASSQLTAKSAMVPAIAQQHDTGEVLMMAWMNRESLATTIETGMRSPRMHARPPRIAGSKVMRTVSACSVSV